MRLDCPYCRRASVDLARATGDPQAVMSCTQHPEDDVPTTDPRIDPRCVEAAAVAVLTNTWGESPLTAHGEHRYHAACAVCQGDVWAVIRVALTAALRAAREAGADAVLTDGTLVALVFASGGRDSSSDTYFVDPLDGGDDGE